MPQIENDCPRCGAHYSLGEELLGRKVQCAECENKFFIREDASVHLEPAMAPKAEPEPEEQANKGSPLLWNVGDVILEDFNIVSLLGEGGMGTVYLVERGRSGHRFAAKRTRFHDDTARRNFLSELQTWIDLPEYPHLVSCRFFRTVGDELIIFAEYVEGGSLADWIRNDKLTRLEEILDVAIQFAWGLHAAHEAGVIHQDVKPANVLMTPEGLVKVTDFGLARTRGASREVSSNIPQQSVLVSFGGMTPAYCSPEQARRQPLTRKTDIWSWGVSVLEMFTQEVTWTAGQTADVVLEDYLVNPPAHLLPMPAVVAEILRRCFRIEPEERWASMVEAAEVLKKLYSESSGAPYGRTMSLYPDRENGPVAAIDRRLGDGMELSDPKRWLTSALIADNRDPSDADALIRPREEAKSRKAQWIADLAIYEEARRIFERLTAIGRMDLVPTLAQLYTDISYVHYFLDDLSGAIARSERAIEIYERFVNHEGISGLANNLAIVFMNKARFMFYLGADRAAVEFSDKAIAIWERLVIGEGRQELANNLAKAYTQKAVAVSRLGDKRATLALIDQAIEIYERLVDKEGQREFAEALACGYHNKACAQSALGDNLAAVSLYDRAIAIYERLVNKGQVFANVLASAYGNKAHALSALGDNQAAVALIDRAIELYERAVNKEGRQELANDLASIYRNKARAVSALGDNQAAVALYDRAIAIYERLVNKEGRQELAGELDWASKKKEALVALLYKAPIELTGRSAASIARASVPQLARKEAATKPSLNRGAVNGTKVRVLLVADAGSHSKLLQFALEYRYDVHIEWGFERTLEAAKEFKPTLIIIDVEWSSDEIWNIVADLGRGLQSMRVPIVLIARLLSINDTQRGEYWGCRVLSNPEIRDLLSEIEKAKPPAL